MAFCNTNSNFKNTSDEGIFYKEIKIMNNGGGQSHGEVGDVL